MHRLTPQDARRIAVRAQLLARPRPAGLDETVRHLTLLQHDPTTAVAPSADLVAWSRLGSSYTLGDVEQAWATGRLVELDQMLRPAEDIALVTAEMAAWPTPDVPDEVVRWLDANDDCRGEILDRLHDEGPLPSAELPDSIAVPWRSSGWNNDRSVRMLLGLMVARGEVAVAGREGRTTMWDLAERVYPDLPPVPLEEARRLRSERRLTALGIARPRSAKTPNDPDHVGEVGEEAVVEGVRGRWRVDPAYLHDDSAGRVALLSPLDRLVFDRRRMAELWGFDYQLEMYKPKAKRRFGYWAMPVLDGEELAGKVDATAERDRGVLRLDAVHEDGAWTQARRRAVDEELEELAGFLGLVLER
ncbi:winged helix DNA-binding domain-containing protein [Nocardioides rotundus]|uniref:DNA glycosylase AlkZ-like family protein n=1 Tax=Nocardioides rotundus TaxID=1774216 RepID=UPI001CBC9746|nr:crosslink repair DNA glycosylase YcaQ family protein [Nocardioides rotundus]UAL29681.1 winged helix DNA-binding domain-containing protein [Nocardioides rotundus]